MVFYELPGVLKTCLIALLLLFNLFQFSYAVLLIQHKRQSYAALHMIFLVFLITMLPLLAENLQIKNRIGEMLTLEHFLFLYLLLWPFLIYAFVCEYKRGKEILGKNAVKEALDQIPVAICFFSLDGLPVLCNIKMYSLAYDLLGKDLQMMSELKECLEAPSRLVKRVYLGAEPAFLLADQSVWNFSRTDVCDRQGREYVQVIGTDVTHLYRLQKELDQRKDTLQGMLGRLQDISENIVDIVRSKEVLLAKERVHGKMGGCLLVARRYFQGGCRKSEKAQFIETWKETIERLYHEIEAEEGDSAFDEMIQIAEGIGVEIRINGKLPEDTTLYEIITCGLREMLTNVVKHAGGHLLMLSISYKDQMLEAVYTNDGEPPKQEITEGGGLSMLRKKVEQAGGRMEIQSFPGFLLRISVKRGEVEW